MTVRRASVLTVLAFMYALVNAHKPPLIDDTSYILLARQMAAHPLDPYGFAIFWYEVPDPANEVLMPPVFPYTLAIAMRVFGDEPVLWKLALAPWPLLFVFAVHGLFRRFAPGLELLLTTFVVFSPAFLPSLNLMLDVPALALGLSGLLLFLQACDAGSIGRAILAGLVAGLAAETKYTGGLALVAMAPAALLYRRASLGLFAALAAVHVFVAWELLTALLYGESHFHCAWRQNSDRPPEEKLALIPILFAMTAGLTPGLILMSLVTLRARAVLLSWVAAAMALGYAAIFCIDANYTGVVRPSATLFGESPPSPLWHLQLAELIFDGFAVAGLVVLVRVIAALMHGEEGRGRRDTLFLLSWLVVELLGYYALTPFPAARRVLGVIFVLTLLVGRLAARTCAERTDRLRMNAAVGVGIVLGLAYSSLDDVGARTQVQAAEQAAAWIQGRGGDGWYVGHWGFQYAAERAGLRAAIPDYIPPARYVPLPPPSRLHAGDWLIVPEGLIAASEFNFDPDTFELAETLNFGDSIPLRTFICFYGGRTPLEHHEGPRLIVRIYRLRRDSLLQLK